MGKVHIIFSVAKTFDILTCPDEKRTNGYSRFGATKYHYFTFYFIVHWPARSLPIKQPRLHNATIIPTRIDGANNASSKKFFILVPFNMCVLYKTCGGKSRDIIQKCKFSKVFFSCFVVCLRSIFFILETT